MFIFLRQDNYHILGIQCRDTSSFQSLRKKNYPQENPSKNTTKDRMLSLPIRNLDIKYFKY
jgi:hypothetical protein